MLLYKKLLLMTFSTTLVEEMGLVMRESLASEDVKTQDEEATALETVTRRQLEKTQQTEKI
jgi:hypothetical protein